MDNVDMQTIATMVVRHTLTTVGGILAAHGYLGGSTQEQFVSAAMVIIGVAWSFWQKIGHAKVAAELAQLKGKGGK